VVVATDSEEVATVLASVQAPVVLTRPSHVSGTDRVAEVALLPALAGFQVVVNVQGDEPFVSRSAVAGAIEQVTTGGFELGTVAACAPASVLADPSVVKVVRADDGRAMYFSRAPIPWLRDAADAAWRAPLVLRHIGIYAYQRHALLRWVELPTHPLERVEKLEQLRALAGGMTMGVATLDEAPPGGIDTEADLADANARWHDLHAGRS
jgi:3-deoxy-manno-octulosonate cytidylyltransferase (CMP-KDO synthetase)